MKRPLKVTSVFFIRVIVILTVLAGLVAVIAVNEKSFTEIVDDDIRNISKLSSSVICSEIENSLAGPIAVGRTMAGDVFLEDWLVEEAAGGGQNLTEKLQRYLAKYSEKYSYDSAFLISEQTGIYYHQQGINKTMAPADEHDVWYYSFVEGGKDYDLDVDVDEVTGELTIFVNCRMETEDGTLLGVAGVGIKMSRLQALLKQYETDYDMKAFLMDSDGLVQVDSDVKHIERTNFYDEPKALDIRERVLQNKTDMELFWKSGQGSGYCLVTQYVENLDWYLVVQKNAERVRTALNIQMRETLMLTIIIIAAVLLLVSHVVGKYNRGLVFAANIDSVTGLPNGRMFRQTFNENAGKASGHRGKLFMFDIDDFKRVNDTYGHMAGNEVLNRVSRMVQYTIETQGTVETRGTVARWGGDEFVGVIYGGRAETEELLLELVENVSKITGLACGVTISLGATALTQEVSLGGLLHRADKAMYDAKNNGKNQAVFFSKRSE